jgi:serine O-acetyltransferase
MFEKMFENLRADLDRALRQARPPEWKPTLKHRLEVLFRHATWPVFAYRYTRACQRVRIPLVRQLLLISALIFRKVVEVFTSVHIDAGADIGPGFVVHSVYAINLGRVKIGKNFTIGSGAMIAHACRGIGDNVYFAAGAKLIGDAKIGSNVVVAANSLVLTDVRDNMMVMGVPARIKLRGGRPMQFFAETADGAAGGSSRIAVTAGGKSFAETTSSGMMLK